MREKGISLRMPVSASVAREGFKTSICHFCVYVSHAPFCEPTDVSDGAIVSPDTFAADSRGRLSLQFAGCIDCGSHFVGHILWVTFCGSYFVGRIAGFCVSVGSALTDPVISGSQRLVIVP